MHYLVNFVIHHFKLFVLSLYMAGFIVVCRFVDFRLSICSPFIDCLYFSSFLCLLVFPMSDERLEIVFHHRGNFASDE